jgi:hypothetical protein
MTSIQIIPRNDTEPHEQNQWCKCNPMLETVNNILIVTHNAYDLREVIEVTNEILNNENAKDKWEVIFQD